MGEIQREESNSLLESQTLSGSLRSGHFFSSILSDNLPLSVLPKMFPHRMGFFTETVISTTNGWNGIEITKPDTITYFAGFEVPVKYAVF